MISLYTSDQMLATVLRAWLDGDKTRFDMACERALFILQGEKGPFRMHAEFGERVR